jgi:methylmalonyl-CoA/ethylmalonyl-CoA epimerase
MINTVLGSSLDYAEGMSTSPFSGNPVAQVAIVVHDIEAAKVRYGAFLGMDLPPTIITEPGDDVRMTYRGEPSNAQTKLAFFNLPNLQIELVEPMGGSSAWQEALDKNGEHVHHLAFWVEGMSKSIEFLAGQGIPMIQRGDMGEGQYAYFDGEKQLGLVLELLERKRDA